MALVTVARQTRRVIDLLSVIDDGWPAECRRARLDGQKATIFGLVWPTDADPVCMSGLDVAQNEALWRWPHIAVEPGRAVAEIGRAVCQVAGQAVGARLLDQAASRGVRGGALGGPLGILAHREKLSREVTEALLWPSTARSTVASSRWSTPSAVARRSPAALRTRLELLGGELLRCPERYGVEAV